jgi:hypothetical protein
MPGAAIENLAAISDPVLQALCDRNNRETRECSRCNSRVKESESRTVISRLQHKDEAQARKLVKYLVYFVRYFIAAGMAARAMSHIGALHVELKLRC